MYRNPKLTKRVHHLTNYRHTMFYTNKMVWIKKTNHKTYAYYYLKNKSGTVKGYVYGGFLTNHGTIGKKTSSTKPTNTNNPQPSPTNPTTIKNNFSDNDYQSEFISKLNQIRISKGLNPLSIDSRLQSVATIRASQLSTRFSHTDSNGNLIVTPLLRKAGITTDADECIGATPLITTSDSGYAADGGTDAKSVANASINSYIYDDAHDNWGHRNALLNPKYTTIGIAVTIDNASLSKNDNNAYMIYNAVGLSH